MSRLEERLRVAADGTIVVRSGKVEFGQGIRVAFARLVAEELRVPLASVQVELGDTATAPWDMGTFGSLSVRLDGMALARAAAFARGCLLERAARRWKVPLAELTASAGAVSAPDGRRASYAELVGPDALAGDIPEQLELTAPGARAIVGTPGHAADPGLVTGATRFAADVRVPELVRGCVLHAPAYGARLVAVDDAAARAEAGVLAIVREGDFIGVVATHARQARAAAAKLVLEWAAPPAPTGPERHLLLRDDAGVAEAFGRAQTVLEADYELPHVANAPLGTSAALADVRADGVTIHAATQAPFRVRDDVARLLGLAVPRVRVIAEPSAGSFGRNNASDVAVEAARLSRAVGRPVLVEWSRADELRAAPNRPVLRAHLRVGLAADGQLAGWTSDLVTNPHVYFGDLAHMPDPMVVLTCGRNAIPPYRVPAARVALRIVPGAVRTGALRSLAGAPNVFAIESALDELAARAGVDPLELRLRNTADPRLIRVLERVAERAGWARRARGSGLGLACAVYNDTYIAQIAELEVPADRRVRVTRAWCALDCGTLVDPDGARNQIEGGIVHAISWALREELRHAEGRVLARGWDDYPIARFDDAPSAIDVSFTDDGRTPPTGVGEPGAVPFGAAIANAVAAACGVRIRTQPITPARLRG